MMILPSSHDVYSDGRDLGLYSRHSDRTAYTAAVPYVLAICARAYRNKTSNKTGILIIIDSAGIGRRDVDIGLYIFGLCVCNSLYLIIDKQ